MVKYGFKQSLMRDTAYELLLYTLRRSVHLSVAQFHEKRADPSFLHPLYAVLAHHYTLAEKVRLEA